MKQALKCVTVLAALSSLALADDGGGDTSKDLKKVIEDQGIYVETAKPGITLSGYVDAGYSYGLQGNNVTVAPREGNDAKPGSNFGLNAFKLALEKPLSTKNEMSAGFRADLIYGQDAGSVSTDANLSSNGFDTTSNLFVEQAFVDFNAPVGNGIQFKVGKFVTPLGYEVVERPSNQDITYGNLFVNMIPVDHTGVLASYKVNDIIDVKGGIVDGWNTGTGTAVNGTGADGVGLLGTFNVTAPGGNANIQQGGYLGLNPGAAPANTAAVLGDPAAAGDNHALWVYDIWGQWKPKFNSNLTLGFNGDIGSYATTAAGVTNTTTWSGAALYAKYQFTKIFSLASRTDWMHNDDGQKVAAPGSAGVQFPLPGASEDIYSYTLTAEVDAWENMLLRAEYRLDYGNFTDGVTGSPTTVGSGPASLVDLEVVYSF